MCPQWILSAQGYKLSFRKNTEDMSLKKAQQMEETSYYHEGETELNDFVTHLALLSLPVMNVFS